MNIGGSITLAVHAQEVLTEKHAIQSFGITALGRRVGIVGWVL
jgi:hypothetical protein